MILVALDAIADTYRMLRARVANHLGLTDAPPISDLAVPHGDFPPAYREDAERLIALEMASSGTGSVAAQADPHPHAPDVLAALVRRQLVTAIHTDRTGSAFTASQQWLGRQGLGTLTLEPILALADDGMKALRLLIRQRRVRVLIEHNPVIAHAIAEGGLSVILLDQPHNRLIEHPRVLRAYGWLGIGALIDAFPLDVRKDRRGF